MANEATVYTYRGPDGAVVYRGGNERLAESLALTGGDYDAALRQAGMVQQTQPATTRVAVPRSGAVETVPGAREAHASQGVPPPMRQRTPFTTVTSAVGPNGSVTPLIGYPSQYPHVINAINDPVAVVGPWLELVRPPSFERRDLGKRSGGGGGGGGREPRRRVSNGRTHHSFAVTSPSTWREIPKRSCPVRWVPTLSCAAWATYPIRRCAWRCPMVRPGHSLHPRPRRHKLLPISRRL